MVTSLLGDDVLFEVGDVERVGPPEAPVGVGKAFRRYDPAQSFLLPPSLDDWLPGEHTARFVAEVVEELLDLSVVYASHREASGAPPFDPRMMLKLLIYGYSVGVTSSREIERRCVTDVAFRWLSANAAPDCRSIAAPRGPIPQDATRRQRMARRLRTKPGQASYARRKAIVEPAFGQMKTRQNAGLLRLRGHDGAQGEWTLHTICHNLRKLANATSPTTAIA